MARPIPNSSFEKYTDKLDVVSADLYSELYAEDNDLKELTETAITGWPE